MKPAFILAVCAAWVWLAIAVPSPAGAADIFRWVDESGQTHLTDKVPDRYRGSAVKVDPGPTQVSPEQQRQTQERNARIKAAADEAGRRQAAEEAGRTAPVPAAPAVQPRPPSARGGDCEDLMRRYRASQACFAPYRLANGALRPEAFVRCGPDVPDPSAQCGVPVNAD